MNFIKNIHNAFIRLASLYDISYIWCDTLKSRKVGEKTRNMVHLGRPI